MDIADRAVYDRAVRRFHDAGIVLPTFAELADPSTIDSAVRDGLANVDADAGDPRNLFRVHWHNAADRVGISDAPVHVVLRKEFTGVEAPIVVALGDRFPMIGAHKVLAAYACLAPRVVSGRFDPTVHRAVWPSTGNYCRGGVAISRIMGCRGVAVLPEGMSRERFAWLSRWVADSGDVITTPGTESNVKEIYDACRDLAADPANVVFNQFAEFANHLVHWSVTGPALGRVFDRVQTGRGRLAACVLASGSAGTLGAGDYLKETYGTRIVAVEALECPTMLRNGFGEHNIQGIGDKHIPLIHNVMNTDVVVDVTDRATDELSVVFASDEGRRYLCGRGVPDSVVASLSSFGLSSICNVVAAVKTARLLDLGPDDFIVTVATDGAAMYGSERERIGPRPAASTFERWMLGADTSNTLVTADEDRERIFNLGYYTWVEQQGVTIDDFVARRDPAFWTGMRSSLGEWDAMIKEFNGRTRLKQ